MRTRFAFMLSVSLTLLSAAELPQATASASANTPDRETLQRALVVYIATWDGAPTNQQRGAAAVNLGQAYKSLERSKEAMLWYDRARKALTTPPYESFLFAAACINLADLYRDAGDYRASEKVLRESLNEAAAGPTYSNLLRNSLADLLREQGRISEARPLFEQTARDPLASFRDRASALIGLADIDRQNQATDASVSRWSQALELARSANDTAVESIALRGLAQTWLEAGSTARAEPLFRRALQMMCGDPSTSPQQIAAAHSGLGQLYRTENKLALAEEQWSTALDIDRKLLGDGHPQVAWLMEMLSDVFSARGEYRLAAEYATRASDAMGASFGEGSMPFAAALSNRAAVEVRGNDLEAASRDYERAVTIIRADAEYRWLHLAIGERYATLLKLMHRAREAKAVTLELRAFQSR